MKYNVSICIELDWDEDVELSDQIDQNDETAIENACSIEVARKWLKQITLERLAECMCIHSYRKES